MEEVNEVAPIGDLLRVHDMNYVMKVMKTAAKQVGKKDHFQIEYIYMQFYISFIYHSLMSRQTTHLVNSILTR